MRSSRCWPRCGRWRRRGRAACGSCSVPVAIGIRASGHKWARRPGAGAGIMITLGELARAIEGAATDSAGTRIESVSTDSRTLSAGALFVALRGPRFDGHDYVQQARQRGAAALMVEHAVPVD